MRDYENCETAIKQVVDRFGKLNILVNNAAYQMTQKKFEDISLEQFRRTIRCNGWSTISLNLSLDQCKVF